MTKKTAPEDLLPPAPYKNTPKTRWADLPRRKKVLFIIRAPFAVLWLLFDMFGSLS